MGGYGSGRSSYTSCGTVDGAKRIDIRYMKKHGLLRPNTCGTLRWSRRGTPTGEIGYSSFENRLELRYRVQEHGGDWETINQTIQFALTPCHYGGQRKWLVCPNCYRRVAVLCMASKRFYCRHCCRLTYGSQGEDKLGRMCRARDKLAERIFESERRYQRKKGMHRKTYEKLFERYFTLETDVDHLISVRLRALEGLPGDES